MRTNVSVTALLQPSSIVKRSRSQSQEAPSFFSWLTMRWPYSSRHAQHFSRKPSRPRSCFVMPCFFSSLMTLTSVAMEA